MTTKIDTVSARHRLTPRRGQYWHRDSTGCYVGYRKMSSDGGGTWWARYRDSDSGRQQEMQLGPLDQYPDHERFDRATAAARQWFDHMRSGGAAKAGTVLEACTAYVDHLRVERRNKTATDLERRFARWIKGAPIGDVELSKLRREQVRTFRKALISTPVLRAKGSKLPQRARSLATVNRDLTALRAALNFAKSQGRATSDGAWADELKPTACINKRRTLYLDREQRRALIAAAVPDLAAFLRGLANLPLRVGALAALKVGDFDRRLGMLKVGEDKHGQGRTIRVPPAMVAFLTEQSRSKLPAAPLFSRAQGQAWDKDAWKWPMKDAVAAAGLPAETVAYTLRHSVITDLVAEGLPTLTIAQISGTSVAMIEKHYGHLRPDGAVDALAKLAL